MGGATASLKNKGSSVVKFGVTDNEGKYSFAGVAGGKYFVVKLRTGHQPASSRFAFE